MQNDYKDTQNYNEEAQNDQKGMQRNYRHKISKMTKKKCKMTREMQNDYKETKTYNRDTKYEK